MAFRKVIIITLILVSLLILVGCSEKTQQEFGIEPRGIENHQGQNEPTDYEVNNDHKQNNYQEPTPTAPPTNLALPFNIEDAVKNNIFVSPFGLIRHNQDKGLGHGGIDIPLKPGDPIYAIADSIILENYPAPDGRGGFNIKLLITETNEGEGWGFLHEHITLTQGLDIGSKVKKGQLIATSSILEGNNHMQLTYLFFNYEYTKDSKCWVDYLSEKDKEILITEFNKIKDELAESWETVFEDNFFPYKGVLNEDYPDGPQLCYPLGTDARVPN